MKGSPSRGCGAHSPSALSSFRSLYRSVRKRLWTSVDFPRPDSPAHRCSGEVRSQAPDRAWLPVPLPALGPGPLTGHHEREVEALLHRLAVHLVGQRGEAHVLLVDVLAGVGRVRGTLLFLEQPRPLPLPGSGQGGSRAGSPGRVASQWQQQARVCGQRPPLRWEAGGPGGWWCPQGLHRRQVSAWSRGNRHIQQGQCPWVGGRGHQDPDPSDVPKDLRSWRSPHLNTHPSAKVEGGRPHLAPIQPRGRLAAATAGLRLFIDSSPRPPCGPVHSPGPQDPAAPVISPVRAPGWARADPLSAPHSTHTLSRLWAWVRGDSSGSTRRSWGAASESIPASLGPCGPRWGPEGQARPPPGVFSPPGRTDAGTGAQGGAVLTRCATPRSPSSRGSGPRRPAPGTSGSLRRTGARGLRETVAWK